MQSELLIMKVRGHNMAGTTSTTVVYLAVCFEVVLGYYCDSDKCSDDEYCCGYNLCCTSYKVWDMWYFWFGLLFFLFLLSMCACLWKLKSRGPFLFNGYAYTPVSREPTYIQTCTTTTPVMMSHGPHPSSDPLGNPPPYANPDPVFNKSPSPPPAYAQVVGYRETYDS